MTGAATGFASALPQWELDWLLLLTSSVLIAGIVCLLTRFGLWISKRPNLPLLSALSVAGVSAVIAFFLGLPIETHAELVDLPAVLEEQVFQMPSAYLFSVIALVVPALIAFIMGRAFGGAA